MSAALPCLEWLGPRDRGGYGYVTGKKYGNPERRIHRRAWYFAHGPIPPGMGVLHHCDNRACAEPTHLFLGTNADNVGDMSEKGRGGGNPEGGAAQRGIPRVTHCKRGHEYTKENTYEWGKFGHLLRQCRQCKRDRRRR